MKNYLQTNWDFNSDALIDVFDETPLWSAPFGLKLLEGINYKKGIKALDIGFGAGFPLTELAMRLGNSSKVYGIDPWEAAIRRAEKKIKIFDISNIEIIHGDIENIPLESNSIDLVVSNNGLNNVEDLTQSLTECARISKPGAQFIQTINLNKTMTEFYSALADVLKELGLTNSIELISEHIYKKRKPLDEYLKMIEKAGFTVESVIHDQFDYRFADGTSMFNHFFIRLAFLDSWKELVPPEQHEQVFAQVEEALNKKAEQEGVLKLSVPFVVIDSRRNQLK